MTFIFRAHRANQLGVGVCQQAHRIGIEGDVRPVLFTIAGHPLEQLFTFLRWLHANTQHLNFFWNISFGLVNKGRHLGPAPGSPAAAVEKHYGRGCLREDLGKLNGFPVDILQACVREHVIGLESVHDFLSFPSDRLGIHPDGRTLKATSDEWRKCFVIPVRPSTSHEHDLQRTVIANL